MNIRPKPYILFLTLLVAICVLNSCARKTPKVYRVGILSRQNILANKLTDSFIGEMAQLGYTEGNNIVYDIQRINYEPQEEHKILEKFVKDKVDLIYTFNTEEALWAKDAALGTGIPVVFANAFTEGNNLVDSVRAPGGNITGVRYPGTDVAVKRLEVLHEIVPQAKRIWVPYQNGFSGAPSQLEILRPVAASLNLTLIEFPSNNLEHLQTELDNRSKASDLGFDAILFIPDPLSTTPPYFATIAKYTRERKIPVGGSSAATKDYGTIFAVTVNPAKMGELAARLADKILKGTPAGTIPAVTPELKLLINYKVAKGLGLTVPEILLSKANEIIR